jgi:hypothetical protein
VEKNNKLTNPALIIPHKKEAQNGWRSSAVAVFTSNGGSGNTYERTF